LILHVDLDANYMADYVALGLSESSNIRPSGLLQGQWPDQDLPSSPTEWVADALRQCAFVGTRGFTHKWPTVGNPGRVMYIQEPRRFVANCGCHAEPIIFSAWAASTANVRSIAAPAALCGPKIANHVIALSNTTDAR
jgi:hypothetical protein